MLAAVAQTAAILAEERPDVIVSAGASPAVAACLLGRLSGARFVFVETAAAVRRPTLTGRLVYRLADAFFYQWPKLGAFYPRGRLARLMFA